MSITIVIEPTYLNKRTQTATKEYAKMVPIELISTSAFRSNKSTMKAAKKIKKVLLTRQNFELKSINNANLRQLWLIGVVDFCNQNVAG